VSVRVSSDKFIFSVPLRWLFVVVARWLDGSVVRWCCRGVSKTNKNKFYVS